MVWLEKQSLVTIFDKGTAYKFICEIDFWKTYEELVSVVVWIVVRF